jgi:hypothetical protein
VLYFKIVFNSSLKYFGIYWLMGRSRNPLVEGNMIVSELGTAERIDSRSLSISDLWVRFSDERERLMMTDVVLLDSSILRLSSISGEINVRHIYTRIAALTSFLRAYCSWPVRELSSVPLLALVHPQIDSFRVQFCG